MTWLKTFGLEALKIINIVTGIISGGSIQAAFPSTASALSTAGNDLTGIATVITDIETAFAGLQASGTVALPAQTGPMKLSAATPLVAAIVNSSSLMKGQKIKNTVLYESAMKGLASNMADLLNSLDPQTIKSDKL